MSRADISKGTNNVLSMSRADISEGTNNVLARLFAPILISSGRTPTTSKAKLRRLLGE